MWHDNETSRDLVGCREIAATVAGLSTSSELLPITIGLYGSWGSGKSSVLAMIQEQLEQSDECVVVRFDGWQLEALDDVRAALMSAVLQAIESRVPDKEGARRLRIKIDWVRAAGLAAKGIARFGALTTTSSDVHLAAAVATGEALTEVRDVVGIAREAQPAAYTAEIAEAAREFRLDFESLVRSTGLRSVVVLIDDLDRCLPESVISVLESIKLFMAVKGTAFVLAVDDEVVGLAVANRFAQSAQPADTARNYLDKLIQVPVLLPAMSVTESENFVYLLYAQLRLPDADFVRLYNWVDGQRSNQGSSRTLNYGIAQELLDPDALSSVEADFAVAQAVAPLLARLAQGNPRTIKRFLNTIELRLKLWPTKAEPPDKAMLARLLILERFHKERFQELAEWQASGLGRASELAAVEKLVRAGGDLAASPLPKWTDRPELLQWLSAGPSLDAVNLSPYFHMSRVVGVESLQSADRLSPTQQGVLVRLRSEERATRAFAISTLKAMEQDAVDGVVSVLQAAARSAGPRSRELEALIEIGLQLPDYAKTAIATMKSIPSTDLTAAQVMQIGTLAKAEPSQEGAAIELLSTLRDRPGRVGSAAKTLLTSFEAD